MLDLKRIKEKLRKALDNETPESMNQWLDKKQMEYAIEERAVGEFDYENYRLFEPAIFAAIKLRSKPLIAERFHSQVLQVFNYRFMNDMFFDNQNRVFTNVEFSVIRNDYYSNKLDIEYYHDYLQTGHNNMTPIIMLNNESSLKIAA